MQIVKPRGSASDARRRTHARINFETPTESFVTLQQSRGPVVVAHLALRNLTRINPVRANSDDAAVICVTTVREYAACLPAWFADLTIRTFLRRIFVWQGRRSQSRNAGGSRRSSLASICTGFGCSDLRKPWDGFRMSIAFPAVP